ncbi:MAG: hypothetical protein NXY57DRAFT_969419 [Lentinula lateritia]|nr:MAG: hypothetical protein NXY57DRAFT_969419 [Lentinula lateritia]
MPAARLLGGFAHFSSNADLCSTCKTSDLNDLDEQKFVPRTNKEHRQGACAWLAAQSEEERDLLFRRNGVRWSELLRLEYWDPIQNTITDPMHGFYLRIFQHQCRQIWGMNVDLEDCDGLWKIKLPTEEGKVIAREVFDHGSASNLRALNADSLQYLALQEGLDYQRNGRALTDSLIQLRVVRQWKTPAHRDTDAFSKDKPLPNPTSIPPALVAEVSNKGNTADIKLPACRQAFIEGRPKSHFRKLSSETIQRLAKEYDVRVVIPAGAPSRAKNLLIDALFKWKAATTSSMSSTSSFPNAETTPINATLQSNFHSTTASFGNYQVCTY